MCGIAGFFSITAHSLYPLTERQAWLTRMMDNIRHRGPDDYGITHGDWFAAGHLRLSILDLSPLGHQPMTCNQGRYVIVYNGEIYNYLDLRKQLESLGYTFKGNSDTEVLLYGLCEWGPSCFNKLEGMFAGAFIDQQEKSALIFRDQLGIKPLYYLEHEGFLFFASEIKAFKPIVGRFSLNEESIYENFQFRFVAGKQTLYRHIKRLLPGTFLQIKNFVATEHTYYSITDRLDDHANDSFCIDEIQNLLQDSIVAHTLSDVGYSIQLSGGIDSSYITTILTQDRNDLDTYSIALPNEDLDESEYQRQVSEKRKTKHHSFNCTAQDFSDLLPKVTHTLDTPLVHTGTVFLYELCRHISKDHKVVLTGEGADELFLGYSRYHINPLQRMAFHLRKYKFPIGLIPDIPGFRGLKSLMQQDQGISAGSFHSEILNDVITVRGAYDFRLSTISKFETLHTQMMASDQTAYLGSLLERQDTISMAFGLEARVPFCNYKLFDKINAIKYSLKTQPNTKNILKEIMLKYYPQSFVFRRKNGFKLPIDQWLKEPKILGKYIDLLTDKTFKERPYFNHQAIEKAIKLHLTSTKDYNKELLSLIAFEIWIRQI